MARPPRTPTPSAAAAGRRPISVHRSPASDGGTEAVTSFKADSSTGREVDDHGLVQIVSAALSGQLRPIGRSLSAQGGSDAGSGSDAFSLDLDVNCPLDLRRPRSAVAGERLLMQGESENKVAELPVDAATSHLQYLKVPSVMFIELDESLAMCAGSKAAAPARSTNTERDVEAPNPGHHGDMTPVHIDVEVTKKLEMVFEKFVDDGNVHHDDMCQALEVLGFVQPIQTWVDEVFTSITRYTTIGIQEFAAFVQGYDARQRRAYKEEFDNYDKDSSGTIDHEELAEILAHFGIEPMSHVLEEVVAEVDEDGSGQVDLTEFYEVMEIVRGRQGFSLREYEDFLGIFKKFDFDGGGEISSEELVKALVYLGFNTTQEVAENIVQEIDIDNSGSMNEREFLVCMRKVRERDIERLKLFKDSADGNRDGLISVQELEELLRSMDYHPEMDVVAEIAHDAGINLKTASKLNLGELWQLFQLFRMREGLNRREAADVHEAFVHYVGKRYVDAELSTLDVGKVLRFMGYALSFEEQQFLTTSVDVDGSGRLNARELRKMIRICREKELRVVQQAFREQDPENTGYISYRAAMMVLQSGTVIPGGQRGSVASSDTFNPEGLALFDFTRICRKQLEDVRVAFRTNGGFSDSEIEGYRLTFGKFDADGSGDINNKELIHLVESLFPEMSADPKMRPRLMNIMQEVDADGNGSLDFSDFLRLMRTCRDMQDRERLEKEQRAVETCSFTAKEVQEFRELFLAADRSQNGELSWDEFRGMIDEISPLGDKAVDVLRKSFCLATDRQCGVEGNKEECDFPEFLWLMQEVLDTNFAGIKEKTINALHSLKADGGLDAETAELLNDNVTLAPRGEKGEGARTSLKMTIDGRMKMVTKEPKAPSQFAPQIEKSASSLRQSVSYFSEETTTLPFGSLLSY